MKREGRFSAKIWGKLGLPQWELMSREQRSISSYACRLRWQRQPTMIQKKRLIRQPRGIQKKGSIHQSYGLPMKNSTTILHWNHLRYSRHPMIHASLSYHLKSWRSHFRKNVNCRKNTSLRKNACFPWSVNSRLLHRL
jgi:hypothetical protein